MFQTKRKCINFVDLLALQLYQLNLDFVLLQTFNLEKFPTIGRVGSKLGWQVRILQLKVNSSSWLALVLFMFGLQNMAINTFHFVNEHHHHNGRIFLIVLGYNCGPHAQITLCDIFVDGYRSIIYRASCFMALVIINEYFSSQYSLWFEICFGWFYVLDSMFSSISILSFMLCGRRFCNLYIVMMPKSIIENIIDFN
jgi:hypothetical protein